MFDAVSLRDCLMSISPDTGDIHMVLDNAKYNHANLLNEFLPPYYPELNPIEIAWGIVKSKGTHRSYFPTVGNLIRVVKDHLALRAKPNSALRKSCTIT